MTSKTSKIIELELEFNGSREVSNFNFLQIASSNCAYVYEVSDANGNRHYETLKRIESKKCVTHIAGKEVTFEAKVKYPRSNDFGLWAWCFSDYSKAMACYVSLNGISQNKTELQSVMTDNISNAIKIVEGENTEGIKMPGIYKQLAFDWATMT